MCIEIANQMLRVGDMPVVGTEQAAVPVHKFTLAYALLASQHHCDAWRQMRILQLPCHPVHQILGIVFVAVADHFVQMLDVAIAGSSVARLDAETSPKVESAGHVVFRIENNFAVLLPIVLQLPPLCLTDPSHLARRHPAILAAMEERLV